MPPQISPALSKASFSDPLYLSSAVCPHVLVGKGCHLYKMVEV